MDRKKELKITSQEKIENKIVEGIFLFPILSIAIVASLISISFIIYLNNIQKEKISELKDNLINEKKELVKDRVSNLVLDMNNLEKSVKVKTKEDLRIKVNEVFAFINNLVENYPKISKTELKNIIKQSLSSIRYNDNRGYFFAYDRGNGEIQAHIIKRLIGKNVKDLKTKQGISPYERNEKILSGKNEGFFSVYFPKPSEPNKKYEKIDFIKYMDKLNWVIGTGEYVEDIEKSIKKQVLRRIGGKKYGKNRYFWVIKENGILLENPYDKKHIGKNILNLKDEKGKEFIKEFIKKAKESKNGAFVSYYGFNRDLNKTDKILGYVKYFKKWGWIVGSDLYYGDLLRSIDNLNAKAQKQMRHFYYIVFSIILLSIVIAIIFSFYFSKKVKDLFVAYKNDLKGKIESALRENTKHLQLIQQQSKLAAMGEMIGAIAHQWRQPLNALAINIQNLEDDYEDGIVDKEFLENFSDKNMQIIQFMSKTIDDFRNFFRADKEKQNFYIKEAIMEIASILSAQLKNNNIVLSIKGEDFLLNGYKSEFQQALLNIINNSKDAILTTNEQNGLIEIEVKEYEVVIKDNGGGIEEKNIEKIFDAYYTTKGIGHGTGVGLHMTKMIIEDNMDGSIYVENTDKGLLLKIVFKGKIK